MWAEIIISGGEQYIIAHLMCVLCKRVWYSDVPKAWKGGAAVKSDKHFEYDFQFAKNCKFVLFHCHGLAGLPLTRLDHV